MNENENNLPEEDIEEEATEEYTDEELDTEEELEEESYTDDEESEENLEEPETEEEESEEEEPEPTKKAEPEAEPTETEEPKKSEPREDKQYRRLLRDTRRALESMGIKTASDEETLKEIVKLAAEQKGQTVEEYEKDSEEEDEFLEFKRQKDELKKKAASREWGERFKKDLEAIQAEFPETKKYTHLSQLPNWKRFGELMESGRLTAAEAFKLSHPSVAEAKIVAGVKQDSLNDTKNHLRSSKPKPASGGASYISKSEMDAYRDMFPELSDAEIRKYHAKAIKN